MISPETWIAYGLPAFGVSFGLVGLAIVWLAARRFDARFGTSATRMPRSGRTEHVLPTKP